MTDAPPITPAIVALLAIAERVAVSTDESVTAWLMENGLIAPNSAMIVDLTERGRVWLDMLTATPLPVEVPIPRWTDPRKAAPRLIDPTGFDAFTGRTTAPPTPISQPGDTTLPAGFESNAYTSLPPGQTPGIFQRDTELELFWRNGKRVKNYAGAVRYDHRGAVDDVMGYRVIPQVQG